MKNGNRILARLKIMILSSSDTSTHDWLLELNPRPLDLEILPVSTQPSEWKKETTFLLNSKYDPKFANHHTSDRLQESNHRPFDL